MSRVEEIQAEIVKAEKLLALAIEHGDKYPTYDEFEIAIAPFQAKLRTLDRQLRMALPCELSDLPKYGDVMSLQEFIECVKSGSFIDYDGSGNYVKDGKISNIEIYPSDIKYNAIRREFDTIIWFNR